MSHLGNKVSRLSQGTMDRQTKHQPKPPAAPMLEEKPVKKPKKTKKAKR